MHSELFALTRSVSSEAFHLAQAVFQAGEVVKTLIRHATVATGQGHRSLATEGDELSRDITVEYLAATIPGVRILSEESMEHPALLPKEDPRGILGKGIFAVIDPVEKYDYDAFCYDLPKRLGFVAGVPSLVRKIWEILPKTGWQRINPDTVKTTW